MGPIHRDMGPTLARGPMQTWEWELYIYVDMVPTQTIDLYKHDTFTDMVPIQAWYQYRHGTNTGMEPLQERYLNIQA